MLLGDVMLGRLVNRLLKDVPPEYVWGDALQVLDADARVANLECVLADVGEPWPQKTFTFRSDAKNVAALRAARIDAISLANNHTLDYGPEALLQCLDLLREHGIAAAGAGASRDEAARPATFEAGGVRVALVACTDNLRAWEARRGAPGVFYVPDRSSSPRFRRLLRAVAEARAGADLVIVSLHWGPNWGYEPPPAHVEIAERLADAGADVIYGHSPHVFRGVAVREGKAILYSCGDFVDDYAVDEVERNDWSFIFRLEYDGADLRRVTTIPTVIREFQARLARGDEREAILARMRRLCADLGTETEVTDEGLAVAVRDPHGPSAVNRAR